MNADNVIAGAAVGAGIALIFYVIQQRTAPSVTPGRLCNSPPPSLMPPIPAGWRIHRGPISSMASSRAASLLGSPLNTFDTFMDGDGIERALIVTWHCHETGQGVPTGWHKGVTLLDAAGAIS